MSKKQRDRHLDIPAEANRDKHINFVAGENNEMDPSQADSERLLARGDQKMKRRESGRRKRRK